MMHGMDCTASCYCSTCNHLGDGCSISSGSGCTSKEAPVALRHPGATWFFCWGSRAPLQESRAILSILSADGRRWLYEGGAVGLYMSYS